MATETKWEDLHPPEVVDFVNRTLEEVEIAKQESREPCVSSFLIKLAEYKKSMKPSDFQVCVPPKYDVKAATLLEFFSVRIQRDTQELNDVGSSFEIYGHIKLTNDYGKEFFLFKREHHDPETVSMLDNRTAILPKSEGYCPRWLPKYFWLELYLTDKSRNVTIVDDEFLLDFRRKVLYDKEQAIIYNSKGYGRVTLNYTIFRSALLALTTLGVSKNGSGIIENSSGTDEFVVAVTGSISANTKVKGKRGLSRVLCDIQQSMSLTMNDDTWLPTLAVPAYSFLRIKADLVVNGERIVTGDDALEFEPVDFFRGPYSKEIMGEKWRICLSVFWLHPYNHLDEDEFVGELLSYDLYKALSRGKTLEEFLESEESWKSEDLSGQGNSSIEETEEMRFLPIHFARHLVEVFSVYVGSFSHERPLRVYGTIKYNDSLKDYLIFEREEMRPEIVFPNKSISLLKPHHCNEDAGASFDMHLELKDAGGREISKGCLKWGFETAYTWYDKRICSVVTGEHGFACVHYAIFDSGVTAKVRARLYSFNYHPVFEVSGSIYARYSTYRCSTNYEKNFYRSTLFKKKKLFLELCGPRPRHPDLATDIPLSKDVVAVPSDTSLILEAKIHVRVGGEFDETIRGELAFDPRHSTRICAKKIQGQKSPFCPLLELEVEWS